VVAASLTGQDGAFRFTDLEPGEYTVIAAGYPPVATALRLEDGHTERDLHLSHRLGAQCGSAAWARQATRLGAPHQQDHLVRRPWVVQRLREHDSGASRPAQPRTGVASPAGRRNSRRP
jgi:hypothetical protein